MSKQHVLVTGATGNQGGAVTEALLNRGMSVRALVRNPDSPKAKALAERGVELVQGDLGDGASVEAAARGVDAVFVLTSPFAPEVGMEGEIKLGRTVIDALVRAQVPHVVYSSVSDADKNTGIPHFETKWDAEQYLAQSGLKYTITAPVFFSDNVAMFWNLNDLKAGRYRQAMPGDRKLQVVSLRDIGRFNAAVIERGPELAGRRINYAGDELTPNEMAAKMSAAAGRTIEFVEQPLEELRGFSEDMAAMNEWFDKVGYSADIEGLKNEFPEVEWSTFDGWAKSFDWNAALAS